MEFELIDRRNGFNIFSNLEMNKIKEVDFYDSEYKYELGENDGFYKFQYTISEVKKLKKTFSNMDVSLKYVRGSFSSSVEHRLFLKRLMLLMFMFKSFGKNFFIEHEKFPYKYKNRSDFIRYAQCFEISFGKPHIKISKKTAINMIGRGKESPRVKEGWVQFLGRDCYIEEKDYDGYFILRRDGK